MAQAYSMKASVLTMNKNKRVDFHIHTYASDGIWSGKELLRQLELNHIEVFAVSDHDTTDCIDEIQELLKGKNNMTFYPGVEVAVTHNGTEHHVLAYNIDPNQKALQDLLKFNRDVRDEYDVEMLRYLKPKFPQVTKEGYEEYKYNPYKGGWKAYNYLMDEGIINGLESYFGISKGFNGTKIFKQPEEVINCLKSLGAITILAHPPAYTAGDLLPVKELDYWKNAGIDGFECYTRYLKEIENAKYYVDYCNKHNLMITGGSDCHGGFVGRSIGVPIVFEDMIRFSI